MTKTTKHNWTPEQTVLLIDLWNNEVLMADIAETIGVASWQVKTRVQSLRLQGVYLTKRYKGKFGTGNYPKRPKVREAKGDKICLTCRKRFDPKWATNFICKSCSNINERKAGAFD